MRTVLVVDDSRVMRQIVARTLRQAGLAGVEVVEADSGLSGLEAVGACRPDLVLSGWNMPEMSGMELLAALRAEGDLTPFGFVTAERSAGMRERAMAAGARFVIGKPFTAEVFAEHLMSGCSAVADGDGERGDGEEEGPTPLPDRKAVRDVLEGLLGRACPIGDGERVTAHLGSVGVTLGEVVTDRGEVAAVVVADRRLAVFAGAALCLVPPGAARAAVVGAGEEDGEVEAEAREAFAEVLNVLCGVFNTGAAQHVRLGKVWVGTEGMPPSVAGAARDLGARDDLRVTVAGYGVGNLSIVLTGF